MNPFYKLNKTLDDIRNEPTQEQKALVESRAPKSPAKQTLEQALRTDLRSLMEDATGGMSGSNTLEAKDKSLSKAAKTIKKGALHKQEGVPADEKIGDKKLNSLKKSGTPLEKKRANFALNIQGKGKKKVKENMGMEECGMGGMEEGATPDELTQQKIEQMKRAASTRKNSRDVQRQPAQGGPRRSEIPAFIRKGRGDPALDHNDLEETSMYSESDKDILDYLKSKLVPNGGNSRAKSRPYNGSAGASDAYNGMEFEEADEYSKHDVSTSKSGGTVYTRKLDPKTGYPTGSGNDMPSKVPNKGSVSKKSNKKEMDECCPHCGQTMGGKNSPMSGKGREVDMEGVKGGMGHFVKAAKKVAGVASAVKKAKKDYDGDGKIETGSEEHAGSVDKAIKANKAKPKTKSPAKPAAKSPAKPATKSTDKTKAKPAKKTEEGNEFGKAVRDAKKDGIQKGEKIKVGGKEYPLKEKKVEETTTSGSVSTAPAKKSSGGGMTFGGSIYDSWERKYENLLKEDVNVTTNSSKNDSGEEEENITINVTGDDVARIKEMLHSMGVGGGEEMGHEHGGEEPCDSCGGVPCQCDEGAIGGALGAVGGALVGGPVGAAIGGGIGGSMEENDIAERSLEEQENEQLDEFLPVLAAIGGRMAASAAARAGAGAIGQGAARLAGGAGVNAIGNKIMGGDDDEQTTEAVATYSDNEPDYPSNQEYSNDEMQYSGGLNGKKSTGQSTLPVVASQMHRLHSHVSEGQHMMDLYRSIQAIENKEV
jgi:tRNA threonylcarbamoyladenosine modification (KEOPS) complex  Pcc1 subunit